MSGVTDLPFRRRVRGFGPQLVVSEMIASKELVHKRPDVCRRAFQDLSVEPCSMQIAGYDPYWMGEAARLAEAQGAKIIDINMGCPAKKVTGIQSGSALMREPERALRIIEAVVEAVDVPVTLKMRTGWDDDTRNAPDLARQAEQAGIQMVTVHGRTRCQFYEGVPDWQFIAAVKQAVSIPVIANGDITDFATAETVLELSHADGLMIGRGAYGRPWFVNQVDHYLSTGDKIDDPSLSEQFDCLRAQYLDSLEIYGERVGVRAFRKHILAYLEKAVDAGSILPSVVAQKRKALLSLTSADAVLSELSELYSPSNSDMAA